MPPQGWKRPENIQVLATGSIPELPNKPSTLNGLSTIKQTQITVPSLWMGVHSAPLQIKERQLKDFGVDNSPLAKDRELWEVWESLLQTKDLASPHGVLSLTPNPTSSQDAYV